MTEVTMSAISDILDSFDIEETSKLLEEQIHGRDTYGTLIVDQFQPLYINYNRLIKSGDATEDEILEGKVKFEKICHIILALIRDEFEVEIDDGWLDANGKELPAVTLALYSFFVLDIFNNVFEILRNYISEHYTELYNAFKDVPRKPMDPNKTASLNPMELVILTNIYDICSYILNSLTIDDYPTYLDKGYIPMVVIDQLHRQNALVGNYAECIANIFQSNISFKSQIGFDLIYRIRNHSIQITDPNTTNQNEETVEE